MGVTGAAIATVVSQYAHSSIIASYVFVYINDNASAFFILHYRYIGSFLMLWYVSKRVILLPPKLGDLKFGVYLKSGGC